ncbi:MAG: hypothetical protein GAK28_04473 [Luteibacter sp.]|uniref:DUF6538 domain-containing protein n=1 Tax=Luteibacter sp. TaxID=1886636 RepID=UPI001386257B|nr:DUF6538 domain-containing protein [Luteibacter sp.]KAF1003706.1 MAG: hypothetical protein GAK28_04473 [Luteibacter sp.]
MPKPFLLRRPSGLYARYWVPLALREVVGSKTIVRSLGSLRGDAARLEAARLGYALTHRLAEMKSQRSARMPTPPSAQLSERIDAYVKTHAAARRPLELFLALVEYKPVAAPCGEDVDRFATQMFDWPRDAGRSALFKDASPQEILARAKRSRADPIVPETWRRSVATVRVFVTALIEKAELDPDFIQAFDRWIGARAGLKAPEGLTERILGAAYSYIWRADGSLDVHVDTEADHRRVMELHDLAVGRRRVDIRPRLFDRWAKPAISS